MPTLGSERSPPDYGHSMSRASSSWIVGGSMAASPSGEGMEADERCLLAKGAVRITTGAAGSEVKWAVLTPCFASLFHAACVLSDLQAPYMLRYFLAGWFEEHFERAEGAIERIHEIIARSDIHLVRRAFVREFDPNHKTVPELLRLTWIDGHADADFAVDCVYEETSGRFHVDWIGPQSTIAKLWGVTPVSYPCQAGGSYDKIVSAAYIDVLNAGRPRYDHVYAAMVTPESDVVWIPYHRVIVPKRQAGARRGVSIVSEIAKVDIQIV